MTFNTEGELLRLVTDQVQESLVLEYKRAAALKKDDLSKNEISKDVSAFANSAGGTLVYGMIETGHLPTGLDGCDPSAISREWLEQIINSRIQQRIQGIEIASITLSGPNAGRVVYVVNIPQSHTAHQASDKKYYKRFNYQSVPMEDYEVRDVMSRAKNPLIVPTFAFSGHSKEQDAKIYQMLVTLHNRGDFAAHHMKFGFTLNMRFIHNNGGPFNHLEEGEDRWFITSHTGEPFFPDEEIGLQNWGRVLPKVAITPERHRLLEQLNPQLRWFIYADNMPRQRGEIPLRALIDY